MKRRMTGGKPEVEREESQRRENREPSSRGEIKAQTGNGQRTFMDSVVGN